MNKARVHAPRVAFSIVALVALAATAVRADTVIYVHAGGGWKFLPGLAEASTPDTTAWRGVEFDDSAWETGLAPFGYQDAPFGTDLSTREPPMRDNYSSLFLRREFEIDDVAVVNKLQLSVDYDDGCVIWLNGNEVARLNVDGDPGSPLAYNGVSGGSHESGTYETVEIAAPAAVLKDGTNVLAVQAFNLSISNSDFKVDVELLNPEGPDLNPPLVERVQPVPETTVRSLDQVVVTFSEAVLGVEAADLLVNTVAATSVEGTGAGPYTFSFVEPPSGPVTVAWAEGHGISDLAPAANAFEGVGWSYTLDPDAPPPTVAITEFQAIAGEERDEDGEFPDWFEVTNLGNETVDLLGWTVTDDEDEPSKWSFPSVTLAPGERVVVFASGKDRRDGSRLHTNFSLGDGGEYFGLYTSELPARVAYEFAPEYPEQRPGYSYGIAEDGTVGYLESPTPGEPNGALAALGGFTADPRFSVERGFYTDPVSVALSSPTPGASIWYTLDGSEPVPESSTPYESPITVEGTPARAVVNLRAVALADGMLSSHVVTHTYVFAVHVLTQPRIPGGFPPSWGTTAGDYEMDPRVINSDEARAMAVDGLHDLPALSISMDVNDFLNPTRGIYTNAAREGVLWERPVSAELIFPEGDGEDMQIDCGLRIQGGSSTTNWKSKKLSMRLLFKSDYGHSKLEYRFFEDSPVSRFDSIVLDAHLNLVWSHPDHGQRIQGQYVRDMFMSDLQLATGNAAPHSRWMNLFINGVFWGIYDVHERPDHSYSAEYFGGDKTEYDAIRHSASIVVNGNALSWNDVLIRSRANLAILSEYEALREVIDVGGLADYMMINFWGGNTDWPHHNWYAARRRVDGERWRIYSWDAEHVLKDVGANETTSNNDPGTPGEVFASLRQRSPEFRLLFADRVHRHFFNGGIFYVDPDSPEWDEKNPNRNRPAQLYMKRINEIWSAILLESARWGDVQRATAPYTRNDWLNELRRLQLTYFPRRSELVLNQFRSIGLYPRLPAPVFSQHGGEIATGFALSMSLPGTADAPIHFTMDGSDPRVYGSGEVSPTAATYTGPVTLDDTVHVKARAFDGNEWSALNEATFTVPSFAETLRITEINYNPFDGPEYEFVELTNVGQTTLDLSGFAFTNGIGYTFGPDTTLAAGRSFVLVADPVAFRLLYPEAPIDGVFVGGLDNGGEAIELSRPDGTVMLRVEYDDENGWPLGPDGFGFTLVLADPDGLPAYNPAAWRASAEYFGSPGEEDPQPAAGGVVINEVLTRSASPFEDAIELFNPTSSPIDVGGWYLSDDRSSEVTLRKFRVPSGTVVPSGGYVAFYEAEFNAAPGTPTSFALDGDGEQVYLTAIEDGGLTGYIAGSDYDGVAAGESLGRVATATGVDLAPLPAPSFGVDSPGSVEEFREGDGAENASPRVGPVVINEIAYNPPSGVEEFIELLNVTGAPIALHDATLGGWTLSGIRSPGRDADFEFPAGAQAPAGGFVIVSSVPPAEFLAVYNVPPGTPVFGPYEGALDNGGERVKLRRPDAGEVAGEIVRVLVDQVRYADRGAWPTRPDGGGPTLERIAGTTYGNDPLNWSESRTQNGTPGAPNTVSIPVDGGHQIPGDANQDAKMNLSDAVSLLGHLFRTDPARLPCGDGTIRDAGNRVLMDVNGDGGVNLPDAVYILAYLFQSGPRPVQGTECMQIERCPELCAP